MTRHTLHQRLLRVPRPGDKRLAVRVTPDALRHIRSGHPWIFEESVTSISHEAAAGDLAVIFDNDRKFVAIALYDPDSPINFRVLHVGKPTPIDRDWWHRTIVDALALRAPFTSAPDADRLAYRVLNGENDGVSGLVVDRYADVLVVKLYSAVWFPHLVAVVNALLDATGCDGVVLRLARNLQTRDTFGLVDGDVIADCDSSQSADGRNERLLFGRALEPEVDGVLVAHRLDHVDDCGERVFRRQVLGQRDVLWSDAEHQFP